MEMGKKQFGLLGAAGFATLLFGGCHLVIGTEERTEVQPLDGVVDSGTEIVTSDLCVEYCDAMDENCVDEHAQYASRNSCINTCNALPPGEAAESIGDNSVQCRLRRANSAASRPEEFCISAGPGGGNSCGTKCEAWCQLLETECPGDFNQLADCMGACSTIADDGTFDLTNSYQNDDLTCRLIHLGAVADDEIHCEHAAYDAIDQCNAPVDGAADCDRYCDVIMGNCAGEFSQYDSRSECMSACEVLPLGDLSHRTENTVGCRIYHGVSAASDTVHCYHASVSGDGHCGANPEDGQTGNCDSYCTLLEAGCAEDFTAQFASVDECSQQCAEDFDGNGAEDDVLPTVATATDNDDLICRTYYAVKAVDGDASACEKAVMSSTCN